MKISKDQFIKNFQETAEKWKGCTDERGTFSSLYYLVLSSLDEFEAYKITSPYIEEAFYKAVSEDIMRLHRFIILADLIKRDGIPVCKRCGREMAVMTSAGLIFSSSYVEGPVCRDCLEEESYGRD